MHTLTVSYRPDNYPEFVPWRTIETGLDLIGEPGELDVGGLPLARAGFAPRLSFGKPSEDADPNTKRRLRLGYEFQVRLQGSGHVIIDRFRLHAQRLIERSTAKV